MMNQPQNTCRFTAPFCRAAWSGAAALTVLLLTSVAASGQSTNAYDVAANYSGFSGNQGYGFGTWVVSTSGGGAFIQSYGPSGKSFDLWNTSANAVSTAVRPFLAPLAVGESFSCELRYNSLDSPLTTNAIIFQDASGNTLFSYYHTGNEANPGNGTYTDANGTGVAMGFSYNYANFSSFTFTLNSALTYTFTDNTYGVSVNGTLSGAPIAQVMFYRGNGQVSLGNGQDFQIDVLTLTSPAGSPPVFTQQPLYEGGPVGSSVTLGATAMGSGMVTYKWYFDGGPIVGATSTNLVLADLSLTNAGSYFAVASDTFGSATSAVVNVTVYTENNRLFAYEGFDYTDNTAIDGAGQNGGSGWNGAWINVVGNNNYILGPASLIGSTNAPAGYDSLATGASFYTDGNSRAGRFLDCSTNGVLATRGFINAAGNVGAAGKTLYVSFLMQPDTTASFYEFEFHRGDFSDATRICGVGNDTPDNDVHLRAPDNTFTDLGLADSFEGVVGNLAVDFYVVRFDFNGGTNDNVAVYRNPTSLTEPGTATAVVTNIGDVSFNAICLAGFGNDLAVDEIRVGGTWADALGAAVAALQAPVVQAGRWTVSSVATPGYVYRVQSTTKLDGVWADIGSITNAETGLGSLQDTNAPAPDTFYRTVTP